jgi:hypothetical protein
MMKESEGHFNLSDSEFERQVANGTLNPSLFNHESRLRLAWLHIHHYGIEKAIENLSGQLLSYASILGIDYKYNKTMTRVALQTVYHFKRQSRSKNFADFILEFPELKFNFKELTGLHYANDTFNSIHERYEFDYVEPEFALVR